MIRAILAVGLITAPATAQAQAAMQPFMQAPSGMQADQATVERERKRVEPAVRTYFEQLAQGLLTSERAPTRGYVALSRDRVEPATIPVLREALAGCAFMAIARLTDLRNPAEPWEGYRASFRCPKGPRQEIREVDFVISGENIDDVRMIMPAVLQGASQ